MIIIFAGSIGRFPVGGHAWIELQYLLGLHALGHDVYYLEECGEGSWVYNWETEELTTSLEYPTAYISDSFREVGLGIPWIYRVGEDAIGMKVSEFVDICSQADLLIVRGAPILQWRPEYRWPKRRIFIDVDPGFTQISLSNGKTEFVETVERCEVLFTIGQRVGASDSPIPTCGRTWLKTVSPVSLADWPYVDSGEATRFTTIMQWRSYQEVVHDGISYGNKDKEFPKFVDLPSLTSQRFRLALTGAPPKLLSSHGWEIVTGWSTSLTPSSYRRFIQESRAEFSVAKHGYVLMRGGWFSDRSVCYLASGRPVLVEDTGLSDWLPTGKGVLTFRDVHEAADGVEAINADYKEHQYTARKLAEQYFATERVLPPLLAAAMD